MSETPITPRGIEVNPAAARPLDAAGVARALLARARVGLLATLDPSGYPHATATNLLLDADGSPVFLAAGLSVHARNLLADPRASLAVAEYDSDVLTTPRLTLTGKAERIGADRIEAIKRRYLDRFPKAALYLALPDAMLFRLAIESVQLNGGPARNARGLSAADLVAPDTPGG